ncbi:hypothetical protein NW754_014812 [Fusarium falciforme]|uniref:DUF7735 domain-containing protein n=1 Tax=Fusarium falciforme TaxID=195108 RepID=A0A9W8UXC8_9HYPO|nr:Hypothetical protein NCS54_01186700 [Fusarium falciforme]KAJ4142022.1 hypothetical protein NW754_014812 [Fusarium falciforme]KAJ4183643.1 hypothetical protein NW755_009677 [Fusarium falciforme]KAJ4201329.1 hypothetical protein NW767_006979 [Fusarium falciforme]KAJ4236770.1 hypothetical protein NW757_013384 [Fusarium falciforme]WAO94290.1 Hypothetical protein NCS54_01186700 [Fusarium falciforme]
MQSKIVLVSLLASAVSAQGNFMAHPQMKRDLLAPRATDSVAGLDKECQEAIMEVYKTLPTPAPEIVKDLTEHPQTNPCSFSTPASLSKEYASYSSEVLGWYSKNEAEIKSALEECPALSKYANAVPICSDAAAAGGDKAEATKTAEETEAETGASKPSGSASAESASDAAATPTSSSPAQATNGAAREGGMIYAAAAVAGIVVAAL